MALTLRPLVEETTTTTGTGSLSLGGATVGHRTFVTAFGDGGLCLYTILWGPHWEYGLGTVTDGSPDTLSRDIVIGSSIGGSKLSLGTGTKLVYCEPIPECFDGGGYLTFTDGDVTPSVKGSNLFLASNTSATTITQFDDGLPGQEVSILCTNGNTTFFHGSVLKHPAAANITPNANDIITYVRAAFASAWQLVAHSSNG